MTNPLSILPESVRLYLYLALTVAGLAFTAWQAADGNVTEAIAGFVAALVNLMAASNTGASSSPLKVGTAPVVGDDSDPSDQ